MVVPPPPEGPGEPGAEHDRLCVDLRTLRTEGLGRLRDLQVPQLQQAAEAVGLLGDDAPLRQGVEALLNLAVDRLGEGRESTAARATFGLNPGGRLLTATDRRRQAARAQAVSVDRFRKHYEPILIGAVAEEVQALVAASGRNGEPAGGTPEIPERPVHGGRVLFGPEQPVAMVMSRARATADWDLVEGVYRQCVDIAGDAGGATMPRDVVGFLSEAFGRIAANYYGREDELVLHAMAILGNVDRAETVSRSLFEKLYREVRFDRFDGYVPTGDGQADWSLRRARPFESLVESARRFRDVTTTQRLLARVPSSGLLGGSLNYGRFFTVRGAAPPYDGSDVDVMVVLPDFSLLEAAVETLGRVEAASREDVRVARERARVFAARGLDDGRTVFSHPVRLWADREDPMMAWSPVPPAYRMDLTFTSLKALDWLLVADTTKLTGESAGHGRSVREYAPHDAEAEIHQRSFSGRNLRLPQEETRIEGGVLRASRAYTIDDDGGRYYPGVLQNMVLPRLSQRWGSGGLVPISGRLEAFRWKIVERLRLERRLRPYELLRLSLAHTRWEMFAPHVRRAVDSGDAT